MRIISSFLFISLLFIYCDINAQNAPPNRLFTAGYANAFIGGLYDGYYPYTNLKLQGDFGLGAPDKLDGELVVLDGIIYQTQSSGKTFKINDTERTPYAVVNFFRADKEYKLSESTTKDELYKFLDSMLSNKNGIYAIHIKGDFTTVKTRAFPPVLKQPYIPLASMLSLQNFFSYTNVKGDLVGYKLPEYMEGANIPGYHFHFLSADKSKGGHIIDFVAEITIIKVDKLESYTVDIPQTASFRAYDFRNDRREELKSVENGKKN